MRNRYPGVCYRCGERVEPGEGHFERHGIGWRTQHADCAIQWRGKAAPTKTEARAALNVAEAPDA
jgi:hypothetical protein